MRHVTTAKAMPAVFRMEMTVRKRCTGTFPYKGTPSYGITPFGSQVNEEEESKLSPHAHGRQLYIYLVSDSVCVCVWEGGGGGKKGKWGWKPGWGLTV